VIRLEEWIYESDERVVWVRVFLREDGRRAGHRWDTTALAWRRRSLRGPELAAHLDAAGVSGARFMPQASAWSPHEIPADKPP